ncbi:hypothetical protein [Photobacterium kasasachensis]|uniref:hypothetical protein n=1 Tax=Photobacterium kasasachensis TaxID=2910240 RepID=UPI003D126964
MKGINNEIASELEIVKLNHNRNLLLDEQNLSAEADHTAKDLFGCNTVKSVHATIELVEAEIISSVHVQAHQSQRELLSQKAEMKKSNSAGIHDLKREIAKCKHTMNDELFKVGRQHEDGYEKCQQKERQTGDVFSNMKELYEKELPRENGMIQWIYVLLAAVMIGDWFIGSRLLVKYNAMGKEGSVIIAAAVTVLIMGSGILFGLSMRRFHTRNKNAQRKRSVRRICVDCFLALVTLTIVYAIIMIPSCYVYFSWAMEQIVYENAALPLGESSWFLWPFHWINGDAHIPFEHIPELYLIVGFGATEAVLSAMKAYYWSGDPIFGFNRAYKEWLTAQDELGETRCKFLSDLEVVVDKHEDAISRFANVLREGRDNAIDYDETLVTFNRREQEIELDYVDTCRSLLLKYRKKVHQKVGKDFKLRNEILARPFPTSFPYHQISDLSSEITNNCKLLDEIEQVEKQLYDEIKEFGQQKEQVFHNHSNGY